MVNMLFRSTLRSIRQSLGRYLAIFAIIALGVGFFAGLRMSQPNMLATGVQYVGDHALFDFRLLSTLGFTEEDIAAFAALEGVETARGGVYTDFLARWDETEIVLTALSLTEGINEPQITAGWMPQHKNECLGDARFFTEEDLGKPITVSASNSADTRDLLPEGTYTLVGLMQTPYYLNQDRGTSSLGSGSVAAFVYIPEDGFDFEAYYEIFLKMEDSPDAYSEDYDAARDAMKPAVEQLLEQRAQHRYDTIYGDALQELTDARRELDDGWAEYNSEKAKADQELADAYGELTDGEREYEDGLAEWEQGKRDYADGLAQYEDGLAELADAKTKLDEAKTELMQAEAELADAKRELEAAKAELDAAWTQLESAKAEVDAGEAAYSGLNSLYQSAAGLAQAVGVEDPGQLMAALKSGAQPQLNAAVEQALAAQGSSLAEFLGGWEQAEASVGQPLTGEYLAALRGTLDEGRTAYAAGLAAYNGALAQYEDGAAQYEDGRKAYEEGKAAYESGLADYEAGVRDAASAKQKLDDAAKELADAEITLTDARKELTDGWQEYENGKAEAEREFADAYGELTDGEAELAEGQEELGDLRKASTYTLTRSENAGYVSFHNDIAIVEAVSVVFPVFFFLVAALVCVTTMTRMVDEQRTQIGILKALGYSNAQILGKYTFYSGSAAVAGSVIGYAAGSTALPWIIWIIYGMMYDFAPLTFLFDPVLAALSLAAALLCSVGATYAACRAELTRSSAELIRPKAPKAGKRVILEYATLLWNRLSFLHKVSVRNVLRYRSRLIMMVLGIGGCTALLLTGFGLKDSLTTVVDEQFNKITLYDYSVTFREEQTAGELAEYLDEKGWEDYLPVHSGSVDIMAEKGTRSVYLVISSADSFDGYISLHHGDAPVDYPGKGELVLNEGLADRLGIDAGDTVRLRCDDGTAMTVTVSALCDSYVNNYAYLSAATYAEYTGEPPAFQTIYLHGHDGADPYAEGAKLLDSESVSQVTVNAATREQILQMLGRLDYLVLVVVLCAGALAFIVLYNLTNINITERVREIATIKVLGFYRNETASYVFREIYMLSALGSAAGIFLGRALHAFVMAQVQVDGVYFPCLVKPESYVLAVGLTLVFTVLISLTMRGKLRKVHMAESLKSVE